MACAFRDLQSILPTTGANLFRAPVVSQDVLAQVAAVPLLFAAPLVGELSAQLLLDSAGSALASGASPEAWEGPLAEVAAVSAAQCRDKRELGVCARASFAYELFLTYFPRQPTAHSVRFQWANLLFELGRFERAGPQYTAVFHEGEGPGAERLHERAGWGAVRAWKKALEAAYDAKTLPRPHPSVYTPLPLPSVARALLDALEDYLRWQPHGEHRASAEYGVASLLYNYKRFEEAGERFLDFAIRHPRFSGEGELLVRFDDIANVAIRAASLSGGPARMVKTIERLLQIPGLAETSTKPWLERMRVEAEVRAITEKSRWRNLGEAEEAALLSLANRYPDHRSVATMPLVNSEIGRIQS